MHQNDQSKNLNFFQYHQKRYEYLDSKFQNLKQDVDHMNRDIKTIATLSKESSKERKPIKSKKQEKSPLISERKPTFKANRDIISFLNKQRNQEIDQSKIKW